MWKQKVSLGKQHILTCRAMLKYLSAGSERHKISGVIGQNRRNGRVISGMKVSKLMDSGTIAEKQKEILLFLLFFARLFVPLHAGTEETTLHIIYYEKEKP